MVHLRGNGLLAHPIIRRMGHARYFAMAKCKDSDRFSADYQPLIAGGNILLRIKVTNTCYIGEPEMAIEAIETASVGDFSIADATAPSTMDLGSDYIQW